MRFLIVINLFVNFLILSLPSFADMKIKQPNVSGQFYNDNPQQLAQEIDHYISQAQIPQVSKSISMIVAPHAGYVYSGPVAAYSFKSIQQKSYKTVVILSPSHFFPFDGVSVWDEGGFQTPLGVVEVDREFTKQLIDSHEKIYFKPNVFEREHALEVEIPFLQKTLSDFKIVPVIIGQASAQTLDIFASRLKEIIGDREDVLIVVSTDLSHYHDDKTAREMDGRAVEAIKNLDLEQIWKGEEAGTIEMCGIMPVSVAILYAKKQGLSSGEILRYANSADVTNDKERVVGYSSIIFYKSSKQKDEGVAPLSLEQKKRLVEIAKNTIHHFVKTKEILSIEETDVRLKEIEGAFVTIHKFGHLRGCIGNVLADGPLYLTVRDMAIAAASQDPRFDPVVLKELDSLEIEVSVLSKPRVIKNPDEIILGKHGVIISQGNRGGLFLPQVADDTGWSKEEFMAQLCMQKAHLSADAWRDPKTKIQIFTADVFSEKDVLQ